MAAHGFPTPTEYTPLAEHEAATPSTFFGGKAVLHKHVAGCRILVTQEELSALGDFGSLALSATAAAAAAAATANGNGESLATDTAQICDEVEVFVNSQDLTIANRNNDESHILRIPYPAISLHATQRLYRKSDGTYSASTPETQQEPIHAIYLQLDPLYSSRASTNPDGDDGGAEATLSIVPPPHDGSAGQNNSAAAQEIFEALSNCADLHPDANADEDDEEGGGQGMGLLGGGSMPGAGGWITAENAHEFQDMFEDADEDEGVVADVDVDGPLGPGAGSKRDGGGDGGDAGADNDDGKWQRTG